MTCLTMTYLAIAGFCTILIYQIYLFFEMCRLNKNIIVLKETSLSYLKNNNSPFVNYSTIDPASDYIPLWERGDIWINCENGKTFMLLDLDGKLDWKHIGSTHLKFKDAGRRVKK